MIFLNENAMQQKPSFKLLAVCALLAFAIGGCLKQRNDYDLVLTNGRIMDPESRLDAVRNIGISNGTIVAISSTPLKGQHMVDASGLVIAPGFIDLHAHGQDSVSNRLQAADGVTTALELEEGVYPVDEWLASRKGKALINYGATVGHQPARIKLMSGIDVGHWIGLAPQKRAKIDDGDAKYKEATLEQLVQLEELLSKGLDEGGLGIGIGIAYTPAASRLEIIGLFELAAKKRVPAFVHLRSVGDSGDRLGPFQEVISNAATTGASVHIVHMNSTADEDARMTLRMIRGALAQGLDVTTESYPYTASSGPIQAARYDSWDGKAENEFQRLQWAATGERLTSKTFKKYRRQNGLVIRHGRSEETNEWIIAQPDVMTASDGLPFLHGPAHPRGSGTFSRILGYYVRERKVLSLMDALRKMTLLPAQRLEGVTNQMKKKGRVQIGADADLTIFDPAKIIDRATYIKGDETSEGVFHVLVGGTFVVRESKVVEGVFPGQAIRRVEQNGT